MPKIDDYVRLKTHCITPYNIGDKKFNIGDMTDLQLEISERKLKSRGRENKGGLTYFEARQLRAIQYIVKYREEKIREKFLSDYEKRLKDRCYKAANLITDWIVKSYK